MKRVASMRISLLLLILAAMTLPACGESGSSDGDRAGSGDQNAPVRSDGDPTELVIAFQKQTDAAKIVPVAEDVAAFLSKELGMPVRFEVPLDYNMAIQSLIGNTSHVAYLDSYNYLKARKEAPVEIIAAELREDAKGNMRADYDSIFVVREDSPLKTFEDLKSNAKDLKFAITNYSSTSGYLMPMRRFVKEGMLKPAADLDNIFKEVINGGNYAGALQSVLIGQADVCAVSFYTVEGESALRYLKQDEIDRVRILSRTPGVPTHLIAARSDLSDGLKKGIQDALLKLSDEKPELLADVYGAKKLSKVSGDDHVQAAVEALEAIGMTADDFLRGESVKKFSEDE